MEPDENHDQDYLTWKKRSNSSRVPNNPRSNQSNWPVPVAATQAELKIITFETKAVSTTTMHIEVSSMVTAKTQALLDEMRKKNRMTKMMNQMITPMAPPLSAMTANLTARMNNRRNKTPMMTQIMITTTTRTTMIPMMIQTKTFTTMTRMRIPATTWRMINRMMMMVTTTTRIITMRF